MKEGILREREQRERKRKRRGSDAGEPSFTGRRSPSNVQQSQVDIIRNTLLEGVSWSAAEKKVLEIRVNVGTGIVYSVY